MKGYLINTVLVVTVALSSCSGDVDNEKKEAVKNSKSVSAKPVIWKKHDEAVSVEDFSSSQPFFSVLSTAPQNEWETITVSDRKKIFKYINTQVVSIDDEIIKSEIVDDQIIVNHGLSTGMSRKEVNSYFLDIEDTDNDEVDIHITEESILFRCCDERENEWELIFENDTLTKIIFTKTSSLE